MGGGSLLLDVLEFALGTVPHTSMWAEQWSDFQFQEEARKERHFPEAHSSSLRIPSLS